MTIGDGHDLKSQRFAGDEVLEACYDNERVLRRGDSGPAVEKIQRGSDIFGLSCAQCWSKWRFWGRNRASCQKLPGGTRTEG